MIDFGTRSASEPSRLWANIHRFTNEMGWAPHYDLASGIERTIGWWRSSPEAALCSRIQPLYGDDPTFGFVFIDSYRPMSPSMPRDEHCMCAFISIDEART